MMKNTSTDAVLTFHSGHCIKLSEEKREKMSSTVPTLLGELLHEAFGLVAEEAEVEGKRESVVHR